MLQILETMLQLLELNEQHLKSVFDTAETSKCFPGVTGLLGRVQRRS